MEKRNNSGGSKKASVASKLCVRCNRVLPLADFYPNKEWRSQSYRDAWCRDCASRYCFDRESLKNYCYENNRRWEDSFYDSALKKAQYTLANNAEFINPKTSRKKKEEIEGRAAARQFFSLMNMSNFYGYVENIGSNHFPTEQNGDQSSTATEKLEYNRKWRGHFTQEQIDALEEIYAQYEEDFVLDNVNIRDYAKKVAKASQNADIAEDRMRRGEISSSDYKEAQNIFDNLSKSSNFAACKRKPGETSGLGSLGEIITRIEGTGKINTEGFQWPKDSVDMAVEEYRHTLVAAGLEGIL